MLALAPYDGQGSSNLFRVTPSAGEGIDQELTSRGVAPYLSEPRELPAATALEEISLLISCGDEMHKQRETTVDVLYRWNQMLRYELGSRYVIQQWDYTRDPSRHEEAGHLADRSERAVDESEGVIAIVGRSVPEITHKEIRHVYELGQLGQRRQLWFFVYKPRSRNVGLSATPLPPGHVSLNDLVEEIRSSFRTDLVYHTVRNRLDFQASVMMEITPYLVGRTTSAFGPMTAGGRA